METKILVLGSKYDVKLPDLKFNKIYTANGAAKLANNYKNKYNDIIHTSVFGSQEFLKNFKVQKSIIHSNPDNILVRNGLINIKNYNFSNLKNYKKFSSFDDLKLQLEHLDLNIIKFIFAELKYKENSKLRYFFRCIKKFYFQGFSTGIFSILLALKENPSSKVLFSGIGLDEGGGHYYTSENDKGFFSDLDLKKISENKFRNTNRKRVEKILFDKILTKYKDRMITTDYELSNSTNISYYNCKNWIFFSRNID